MTELNISEVSVGDVLTVVSSEHTSNSFGIAKEMIKEGGEIQVSEIDIHNNSVKFKSHRYSIKDLTAKSTVDKMKANVPKLNINNICERDKLTVVSLEETESTVGLEYGRASIGDVITVRHVDSRDQTVLAEDDVWYSIADLTLPPLLISPSPFTSTYFTSPARNPFHSSFRAILIAKSYTCPKSFDGLSKEFWYSAASASDWN